MYICIIYIYVYIYSDISTNHISQPVSVVDLSFIYMYSTWSEMRKGWRDGRGQRPGKGKEGQKEK